MVKVNWKKCGELEQKVLQGCYYGEKTLWVLQGGSVSNLAITGLSSGSMPDINRAPQLAIPSQAI